MLFIIFFKEDQTDNKQTSQLRYKKSSLWRPLCVYVLHMDFGILWMRKIENSKDGDEKKNN